MFAKVGLAELYLGDCDDLLWDLEKDRSLKGDIAVTSPPSDDWITYPDWGDRFWSKVVKEEIERAKGLGPCWIWTAATVGGYGFFWLDGKQQKAHRVSCKMAGYLGDEELCALHKCDQPACIRPSHLFEGTVPINNHDRHIKGRDAKGERSGSVLYPERLPNGVRHWKSKLTWGQVQEIRSTYIRGVTRQIDIAAKYGVGQSLISEIIRGEGRKIA